MRQILLLVGVAMLVAGGGFAQQSGSTSSIVFETTDGRALPVYEIVGQSFGGGSFSAGGTHGSFSGQATALRPAFMAPTTVEVPSGWHRYQIYSGLFSGQFDVVSQGRPQRWLLNGGNVWLSFGGGLFSGFALATAIAGASIWLSGGPLDAGTSALITIGGVAGTVGGAVLCFSFLPSATRTQ